MTARWHSCSPAHFLAGLLAGTLLGLLPALAWVCLAFRERRA